MTPILNIPIGDRDLCAWQPVRGITWIQTRNPHHNRRLSQRMDGRLVAVGVYGGYLRTYEFTHSLAWASRLIARYIGRGMPTNVALNAAHMTHSASETQVGVSV
jgi:hypothetical protein